MATKKRNQPVGKGAAKSRKQAQTRQSKKSVFASRYIGVDPHLSERKDSTEHVFGVAIERPAGRKLSQEIEKCCNQLDAEGYEVMSIFPLISGRVVEASLESTDQVHGRTYTRQVEVEQNDSTSTWFGTRYENRYYFDTGMGYSVTDGVIITAKLRK